MSTLAIREHRLGDAVRRLELRGTLDDATLADLARRIDAAAALGVRWLVVDLAGAVTVSDAAVAAVVSAARELRARGAELIVVGAAERFAAVDVAHRPVWLASAAEAVVLLKTGTTPPRARQRVAALELPRLEPGRAFYP